MTNCFKGKKLLILAGAGVHCKVVRAAKEMGIYTIVTDYLKTEDSPAKQIADEAWELNITDIDAIVQRCKEEKVDGVLNFCIDPAQKPYQQICEKLGLPCIGTKEQFEILTDKRKFKDYCIAHDIDVIPGFTLKDSKKGSLDFPVFVKPAESRGSRGQTVCHNLSQLQKAIDFAKKESFNDKVIIEKYFQNKKEFQVTYFFIDGRPYLIRTVDSYCGPEHLNLEKVVSCAVSPSCYTELFLKTTHKRVVQMFKSLGIKNGPVFMQGLVDGDSFRFFDPGLRFPGVDYELIYNRVYNINIVKKLISFALCSNCCEGGDLSDEGVWLNGKRAAVLFPNISAGKINKIKGLDIKEVDKEVLSILPRYKVGDIVGWNHNVNQRSAEVDILCESTAELKRKICNIQKRIQILDEDGNNMTYNLFDVSRIK